MDVTINITFHIISLNASYFFILLQIEYFYAAECACNASFSLGNLFNIASFFSGVRCFEKNLNSPTLLVCFEKFNGLTSNSSGFDAVMNVESNSFLQITVLFHRKLTVTTEFSVKAGLVKVLTILYRGVFFRDIKL